MKRFTVDTDDSLKDFTDRVYPQGSFAFARLLRERDIRVNGDRVGKNMPVHAGDEVVYYTTPAQEKKPSHTVVYADENVYVADKESGVSSEGLCSELCGAGEFYAVHRLDRNTRGLIVFAKNRGAERRLIEAFREKRMGKTYLCIAKNGFTEREKTLVAYLKKEESGSFVRVSDTPRRGYAEIVTAYAVERTMGDCALVSVTLHTGKTHQIRAHLAHIGCPVVGDEKYGDGALNEKYGVRRQLLVAKRLVFGTRGELSYLNGRSFESAFFPELGEKK